MFTGSHDVLQVLEADITPNYPIYELLRCIPVAGPSSPSFLQHFGVSASTKLTLA